MPIANPVQGFTKSHTTVTYRLGAKAMKTLTEQELFPYAKRAMSGLMDSGKLLLEYSFADVLNQATTATGYDGADGVPLASASHPHERRQTGTWSNLETAAALSHSTFSTARTTFDTSAANSPRPLTKEGVGNKCEAYAAPARQTRSSPTNAACGHFWVRGNTGPQCSAGEDDWR